MFSLLFTRLYARIWVLVVGMLLLLSVFAYTAWHIASLSDDDHFRVHDIHQVQLLNEQGEPISNVQGYVTRLQDRGIRLDIALPEGPLFHFFLPRPPHHFGGALHAITQNFGYWSTTVFALLLLVISLVLALAAYPVVRQLTKRLEALHQGTQRLQQGDFKTKVPVQGNDEIADLARQFNLALAHIDELIYAKKMMLASASHELRSPLARLRMGLEFLGQGTPEDVARHYAQMKRAIDEIDTLVEELLLAGRIEVLNHNTLNPQEKARKLGFEPFDLLGLAAEECARVNANLETSADKTIEYTGSPRLVRRLLRNLLENARHYAGYEGIVTCIVSHDSRDNSVHFWVRDNGPGVPVAERERVFDPFYRIAGSSEEMGNVGLGLALVRQIAHEHGGTAQCVETGGVGALFHVVLPAQRFLESPAHANTPLPSASP